MVSAFESLGCLLVKCLFKWLFVQGFDGPVEAMCVCVQRNI